MIHCIKIERKGERYTVEYEGEEIGVWRVPCCSAARWMISNAKAKRGDTLRSFRGSTPCMKGNIGWLADRTVYENDQRGGAPYFTKWIPVNMDLIAAARRRKAKAAEAGEGDSD